MDMAGMTLEGFFIADYERLRKENEELRAKIEEATREGYGITDMRHETLCVKIDVALYHAYGLEYEGITSEALRKASEMDDSALWVWAIAKYRNTESTWRSALQPIAVSYREFHYSLKVSESRATTTFVTDVSATNDESDMYAIKDWEGEECLGVWQDDARYEYVKAQALEMLRNTIKDTIPRLERLEAEKAKE